jgi:hypothetical protein
VTLGQMRGFISSFDSEESTSLTTGCHGRAQAKRGESSQTTRRRWWLSLAKSKRVCVVPFCKYFVKWTSLE